MYQTDATRQAPRPLDSWLQQAAQRSGDAVALESAHTRLTYKQLNQQVLALATQLTRSGVSPGDRLAIAADRDVDTIVAILAVVHVQAAYVPLDLSYPADRLSAMLQTAQPVMVLGSTQSLTKLHSLVGQFPTLAAPARPSVQPYAAQPGLTYVLFTSGSTGTPKGVAMGDLPLRHLIDWHAAHRHLGRPARTLQFAPLSFDVHFQEIFSTLACGGTLVLIAEDQRRDPALLTNALRDMRVERIFVPYIALQMIAQAAQGERLALQDVVSAGEQLQVTPAIRAFFLRHPGSRLHNHYGPTESHVVTAHELEGDPTEWPEIPPIGTALPHVKIARRNEAGAIDNDSGQGELLLGGETLAYGYLGKPELSKERFDTLNGLQGTWYFTGDLVRPEAGNVLHYLGRADQQLKVDGFRIEPGEIELALMAHSNVKDAVVTAPEIPGVGKQLVAYVVLSSATLSDKQPLPELRAHLRERLPEYMVPVRFVVLDRLPTTPSGKIDRRALPMPQSSVHETLERPEDLIRATWQELLGIQEIAHNQNLFDLGARSLLVLRFVGSLQAHGIKNITVADVYDRPTIAGIAAKLQSQGNESPRHNTRQASRNSDAIAIIGMATRTAGADNVEQFWQNLLDGREGIRHFQPHELDASIPESTRSRPNFVAARGAIENVGRFDATFFGIGAREATLLDPQQRMLLELAWNALEHAGIDPTVGDARIGVYAGTANNSYVHALRDENPELIQQAGEFATMLASEKDYVATRIAHRLNLNGPAVSVHTACSTGLVAVVQAWHALASGQCDIALAGGATVIVPQEGGYLHVEGAMESADGHCRPFDAKASGTVFASGGALVALKRLEDAQRDGDNLYAVIRGVGLNNDGGEKASFTAPSVSGQAAAIRMALEHANLGARSIGYVEAHGTGTALGDPIEIAALTQAWSQDTNDRQFCGIGSVKGNLGHTIAAAGVLGLIKAAFAVRYGIIPKTLHYQSPNPQIDFGQTPFKVIAENSQWQASQSPRRAAVSSFGVGGTNAHVILESVVEPAFAPQAPEDGTPALITLSARTPEALLERSIALASWLEHHPDESLSGVEHTLAKARASMDFRIAVAARTHQDAAQALKRISKPFTAKENPRLVFLFPGQGSQHPGMAASLYKDSAVFRDAFDHCMRAITPTLGLDLTPWLVDAAFDDAEIAAKLAQTRYTQPALFAMHHALAQWLAALGLRPTALIGHSVGEYAAACHAGVMSVTEAAQAVVARGAAMSVQAPGAMLAVKTGSATVADLLPAGLEIAGFNAPTLAVVAGPAPIIEQFCTTLETQMIEFTRLKVSHAFHSAAMEGALPTVKRALEQVQLKPPTVPVYSCVNGKHLQVDEAQSPSYWASQVRAPVRFSDAISAEINHPNTVFVEVGPSQALSALVRQHRNAQNQAPLVIPLLGSAASPGDAMANALQAVGTLWSIGAPLAWPKFGNAKRVALPTYPFAGDNYWFKRRDHSIDQTTIDRGDLNQPAAASLSRQSLKTELVIKMSRIQNLQQELLRVMSDVSGIAINELAIQASFTDQGLDSLSLTQATLEIERVFSIKLRFRRLLEDLDTIEKLAAFFDKELEPEKFMPSQPSPVPKSESAVAPVQASPSAMLVHTSQVASISTTDTGLQQIVLQQMQLMSQQLALLAGQPSVSNASSASPNQPTSKAVINTDSSTSTPKVGPVLNDTPSPELSSRALVDKPFGASARITLQAQQELTSQQHTWLQDFVARYNVRTGKSKAFSQKNRDLMADPRVVTGFNPLWKDLVYPIVAERSKGAHVWDLDGNQYIDLLSCFGANFLGYQPESVIKAMHDQLEKGIEVGPQHPLSAEVAQLIAEFTGMQRVAFCNTGSEAVMGAMRIARTVTGKKTIAIFTNSYHGIFDEVIVRGTKQLRSLSAAPGILANAVENILVLDWASDESLRILRARASELAAIMTEPVQNKYPTIQPRAFLQELRKIADSAGCALVFDEVVTGFRVAPGGAQEFYGVRADIATYGKIIGGGLPFAAIAGGTKWLDALDGGTWCYGDDSYPEAGVTYFAGTFVRHPLALAAAHASLLHIKTRGRALYQEINGNTQRLIDRLNDAFAARGAPVKAVHCTSLWRLSWDEDQKFVSLFYYLARYHGLHLYEQFGHFVTEAMGEAELEKVFSVFTQTLDELLSLGFITPRPGTRPPGNRDGANAPLGPLAPGQTERWLAASFDTHARKALNESFFLDLKGPIDLGALRAALQDVIDRHDAFRITFDPEEPVQKLAGPASAAEIAVVDMTAENDFEAALSGYSDLHSIRDFGLTQAPLAKFSILQASATHVVVHVVVSHLIFDGWATPVFLADLAHAYRARTVGTGPNWIKAESAVAFGRAEHDRWNSPKAKESLAYWCEQLKDAPAPLILGDKQPPETRQYPGATLHRTFGKDLASQLRKVSAANKATLFQVLFASVAATIKNISKRDDFVVSIPFASQSLDHHEGLIADGVLDLPIRIRLKGDLQTSDVISIARNQLMDAMDYPLATQGAIARILGLSPLGNRPPITGVYFNLNPRLRIAGFEPLEANFREGTKRGLLSEVIFNFYEEPDRLELDLHYSTEFFTNAAAEQLVTSLESMLAVFVGSAIVSVPGAAPETVLREPTTSVDIPESKTQISASDLRRLKAWNNTAAPYEPGLRLGDLIRRTVVGQPDAVAIRFEGRAVTYADLDRMAWSIAYRLRDLGVKPGDLVGVCLDRSVELVVALVGVVYSGGAYVPLDPDYPAQRLTHMCEDANLKIVVSGEHELKRVKTAFPAHTEIVALSKDVLNAPTHSGELVGTESDPAYVIFTSGSTGRPKGAINSHKGVVNWLLWMQQTYNLSPQDKIIQKTPYSFDVSLREFFWPLIVGAVVVVARPGGHREAEYLVSLVEAERITVIHFVPSMLQIFLDEPGLERCSTLRLTMCSGEALPISAVNQFFSALPNVRLVNLYGPTEAAVEVTYWECKPNDPRGIVPIGFPVANTQMHILNDKLELVRVGESGDLYIGGVQVGIGYANRPELTNERFLADPFVLGGRIYKTGDVARWLDDGSIEYLGRSDYQVKIRGFRIELGEIEARLMEHNDIARCVVIAHDFGGSDNRLVAYLVLKSAKIALDTIRLHLAAQLPEHMVPAHFEVLDTIPLLPNGKIDRKSLPPPTAKPLGAAAAASPKTETETAVATVMAEMLKLPQIGIDDNFFSLGGHSLIAAKVVSQLNRRLGTQLTLRAVFESPTAARLAASIDKQSSNPAATLQRTPIIHLANQIRAPLTLMQERIRFIEEMRPGRIVYNTPSAHRLTGSLNAAAFDRAFSAMIERQPALRTAIVNTPSGYVQELRKVSYSILPVIDLSELPSSQREEELNRRLEALVAQPFNLSDAPLFSAKLFKLAAEEHVLFFMAHHIIWDGWSFDVLYSDLSALYDAYANGKTPQLPPLALTYADYSNWHKDWLASQELKDQVTAWKRHFQMAPAPRSVLGDYPRELATGGTGSTEWMHFDSNKAENIRALAKRTGSTLSMVALAVYSALLSDWMNEPCPAIGMPVRGRAVSELEPIMGFFNNMLPIRLQVNTNANCLGWITTVRDVLVDVFGSQEAPFELLARSVGLSQSSSTPLYQAMFSFQDARARQTYWGNLAHERVPLRQQGATEDINLWMVEIPNGIEAGIQYNAQLFMPETIQALKDRFIAMLDELVAKPEQTVQQLIVNTRSPLLSNKLATSPDGNRPDLVAAIGAYSTKNPGNPALTYNSVKLTYSELRDKLSAPSTTLALSSLEDAVDDAGAKLNQWIASVIALASGKSLLSIDAYSFNAAWSAFDRQIHLLGSDTVLVPETCPSALFSLLTASAWCHGAHLQVYSNAQSISEMDLRSFSGVVFVRDEASLDALSQKVGYANNFAVIQTVQDASVQRVSALLRAKLSVYNTYISERTGLPVTLSHITDVRDVKLMGTALESAGVCVCDRNGAVLPSNVMGVLGCGEPNHIQAYEPITVRWLSDGSLQYIGPVEHLPNTVSPDNLVSSTNPASAADAARTERIAPTAQKNESRSSVKLGSTQDLMIGIWREVLGVPTVLPKDNFFELGGNSLSAMQAAEAIEQKLDKRISPRRYVFETLAQLAAAYDEGETGITIPATPEANPLSPMASQGASSLAKRFKRLVGIST
jgi:amino acid adenylation domain-containing protein